MTPIHLTRNYLASVQCKLDAIKEQEKYHFWGLNKTGTAMCIDTNVGLIATENEISWKKG
jgi:hypothetical protein